MNDSSEPRPSRGPRDASRTPTKLIASPTMMVGLMKLGRAYECFDGIASAPARSCTVLRLHEIIRPAAPVFAFGPGANLPGRAICGQRPAERALGQCEAAPAACSQATGTQQFHDGRQCFAEAVMQLGAGGGRT